MLNALIMAQLRYRLPMLVTESYSYIGTERYDLCTEQFYICPRCRIPLERDYQTYCDRCGQRLDWRMVEGEDG